MTNELAIVKFDGGELACTLVEDVPHVSVRHVCEALGLQVNGQLVKLRDKVWSRMQIICSRDSAGRVQDIAMIPAESLPIWMATVSTNKVASSIRRKLEKYQLEAAKVLAGHFMPETRDEYGDDPMVVQLMALARVRQHQLRLEAGLAAQQLAITRTQQSVEDVRQIANEALDYVTNSTGFLAIKGYARKHGIKLIRNADSVLGRMATARCKAAGLTPHRQHHEIFGEVNAYPIHILEEMHAEFLSRAEKPMLKAIG